MLSFRNLLLAFGLTASINCISTTTISNSSSSAIPTPTTLATYCGSCALVYEVHALIWYPTVVTNVVSTMIYTVENGTGSTIGSHLKPPTNATSTGGTNFTAIAGANGTPGVIQYVTFPAATDAASATIVQQNFITFNASDYRNGYVYSTIGVNASETRTSLIGVTQCLGNYYVPKPTNTNVAPYLPATTEYDYTTVVPFGTRYNMTQALNYGLDILASSVAFHFHLTVPNCTSYGGGYGTLKVPVVTSVASETLYAAPRAQVIPTTTTMPAPAPPVTSTTISTVPITASSSSSEPSLSAASLTIQTITPISPLPSINTALSYTTTLTLSTSGPGGPSLLTLTSVLPVQIYTPAGSLPVTSSTTTTVLSSAIPTSTPSTIPSSVSSLSSSLPGPSAYTATIIALSGTQTISRVTVLPIVSDGVSSLGVAGTTATATVTALVTTTVTATGGVGGREPGSMWVPWVVGVVGFVVGL